MIGKMLQTKQGRALTMYQHFPAFDNIIIIIMYSYDAEQTPR